MPPADRPVDVAALVAATEALYPPHLAESWDRIGLVAGVPDRVVTKVMVAVDPTLAVAAEAVEWGAQLLLVHHPLMLAGVHGIPADSPHGAVLTTLLENRCALLTAHTNADAADPGVSDAIAERLGLTDLRPLLPMPVDELAVPLASAPPITTPRVGIGRVGILPGEHTVASFAALVAKVMPRAAAGVRVAGDLQRPVRTVALCGGSGDSLLSAAAGFDVYLTSDLRHHRVLDHLAAGGCPVVDIAHWAAERPWCDQAAALLPGALSALGYAATSVEFRTSALPTDPWTAHQGSPQ